MEEGFFTGSGHDILPGSEDFFDVRRPDVKTGGRRNQERGEYFQQEESENREADHEPGLQGDDGNWPQVPLHWCLIRDLVKMNFIIQ